MYTPQPKDDWTDERITKLEAMWADGDSASIIGAELGITRSAVIGKIHRLRLPKRETKHGGSR